MSLKAVLDAQYEAFNVEDSAIDPVQFVHRANPDPADREIVGFVAAGLAFGRVASVMASVGRVVEVPIRFADREVGGSKMSKAIVLEAIWRVPLLRLNALRGRL